MSATFPPPPINTPVLLRESVIAWINDPQAISDIGIFAPAWAQWLTAVASSINSGGGGGGGGSVTSTVQQVTLTADTTITPSLLPAADGDLLFIFITQDGTGGWVITWGTGISSGAITDVDGRAGKLTVYAFVGISGAWNEFIPPFMRP